MFIVGIALLAVGMFVVFYVVKLLIQLLFTPLKWLIQIGIILVAAFLLARLVLGWTPLS
jgi:hypothetical protein